MLLSWFEVVLVVDLGWVGNCFALLELLRSCDVLMMENKECFGLGIYHNYIDPKSPPASWFTNCCKQQTYLT